MASDSELEVTFARPEKYKLGKGQVESAANGFRSENFMAYTPTTQNLEEDRAYGVHSGSNTNFAEASRGATMDLAQDEAGKRFGEARGIMRWDKRQRKYVARQNDDDGSKGKRLVKGESGAKIAASFRSGRYDAWRKAHRVGKAPRIGETEKAGGTGPASGGKRYRHQSTKSPKEADKFREDYDKRRKKVAEAKERLKSQEGKKEIRSVDDIRKQRKLQERRKDKNARPSKKPRR